MSDTSLADQRTDAQWLEAIQALSTLILEHIGEIKKSGRQHMDQTLGVLYFRYASSPHFFAGSPLATAKRVTLECVRFWGWSIRDELKKMPFIFEGDKFGSDYENSIDWYERFAIEAPLAATRYTDALRPESKVLRQSLEIIHGNVGCAQAVVGAALAGIMSDVTPDEQIQHTVKMLNEQYDQLAAMKVEFASPEDNQKATQPRSHMERIHDPVTEAHKRRHTNLLSYAAETNETALRFGNSTNLARALSSPTDRAFPPRVTADGNEAPSPRVFTYGSSSMMRPPSTSTMFSSSAAGIVRSSDSDEQMT